MKKLELSHYFPKLIFNQQIAAPQKVPPGTRRPQGPSCYATAKATTF